MPRPAAASSSAESAAAVSRDGFSFAHGELFAHASGQNQHRRATLVELRTHFSSGTDADRPAHWFEAQLIHYGLKSSKTKSVARMRLHDAVREGTLTVPATITRLEGELKKEWAKNDRAAKKAAKTVSDATPASSAGVKRKANDAPTAAKASPLTKKVKSTTTTKRNTTTTVTTTTTTTTTTKAGGKEKKPAAPKAAASKAVAPKAAAPKATAPKAAPKPKKGAAEPLKKEEKKSQATIKSEPKPRATSTARRGGASQGSRRGGSSSVSAGPAQPVQPPRPKQTARRSGAFMARGRIAAPAVQMDWEDMDMDHKYDSQDTGGFKSESDQDDDMFDLPIQLAPLGLLNGYYDISSRYVSEEWPDCGSNFDLTLTLDGSRLWGKFDLGIVEGVLFFPERPWDSSHNSVSFIWRGQERDGPISYGNDNVGSITFLGDGYIEGFISLMSITFRGRRAPGQGTTSRISASQMKNEWEDYSEERYEYENRARW